MWLSANWMKLENNIENFYVAVKDLLKMNKTLSALL